jgi:hypothetical protein
MLSKESIDLERDGHGRQDGGGAVPLVLPS